MSKTTKRSKQVEAMVKAGNATLKARKVISEYEDSVFWFTYLLQSADCYKGFNWFYEKQIDENTTIDCLVGSADEEVIKAHNGFIQFY